MHNLLSADIEPTGSEPYLACMNNHRLLDLLRKRAHQLQFSLIDASDGGCSIEPSPQHNKSKTAILLQTSATNGATSSFWGSAIGLDFMNHAAAYHAGNTLRFIFHTSCEESTEQLVAAGCFADIARVIIVDSHYSVPAGAIGLQNRTILPAMLQFTIELETKSNSLLNLNGTARRIATLLSQLPTRRIDALTPVQISFAELYISEEGKARLQGSIQSSTIKTLAVIWEEIKKLLVKMEKLLGLSMQIVKNMSRAEIETDPLLNTPISKHIRQAAGIEKLIELEHLNSDYTNLGLVLSKARSTAVYHPYLNDVQHLGDPAQLREFWQNSILPFTACFNSILKKY